MLSSPSRESVIGQLCAHCHFEIDTKAKYCGNCGSCLYEPAQQPDFLAFTSSQYTEPIPFREQEPESMALNSGHRELAEFYASTSPENQEGWTASAPTVPTFAPVRQREVDPSLKQEWTQHHVSLLREHFFLGVHWTVFVIANLFGLWLSLKCYFEFVADDMTRLMMASTPLLWINLTAFTCLSPIKGTKREIARLRERISFLKFKMEYDGLL